MRNTYVDHRSRSVNLHRLLCDKNDVLMPLFDSTHCVNTLRADNWSVQSPQSMHMAAEYVHIICLFLLPNKLNDKFRCSFLTFLFAKEKVTTGFCTLSNRGLEGEKSMIIILMEDSETNLRPCVLVCRFIYLAIIHV